MSNETKHTPEPWQYTESGVTMVSIIEPDGHTIFHCNTLLNSTAQRLKMENARRIVACVNACAGIPTVDLENAQSRQNEQLTGFGKACEQRDELAAALRDLENWATARGFQPDMNIQPVLNARAALAKVSS